MTYSAVADLNKTARDAGIVVNEAEQLFAVEGINIAVYDNEYGAMVNMLTLYSLDGELHVYNKR